METSMSNDQHDSDAQVREADIAQTRDADTLSPSVRRLVRQYDLDVTAIPGSGPQGRIRVGDVMAVIGGRVPAASTESRPAPPIDISSARLVESRPLAERVAPLSAAREGPMTTVFECDVSRVLAHQRLECERGNPVLLTTYFAFACARAMTLLRDAGGNDSEDLGVVLPRDDGTAVSAVVADVDEQPFAAVDAYLASALSRGASPAAFGEAATVLHHHGAAGSVLALPLPLPLGRRATIGAGAVRRTVAVRTVNGEEAARVVSQCYLTLTFATHAVTLAQADLFLRDCVRTLESWPVKAASP